MRKSGLSESEATKMETVEVVEERNDIAVETYSVIKKRKNKRKSRVSESEVTAVDVGEEEKDNGTAEEMMPAKKKKKRKREESSLQAPL